MRSFFMWLSTMFSGRTIVRTVGATGAVLVLIGNCSPAVLSAPAEEILQQNKVQQELIQDQRSQEYVRSGRVYQRVGQVRRAIEDYNKAISINPKNATAYFNRGTAYEKLGQPEKAIQDFTIALSLDPEDAAAYWNRGKAYVEVGRLKEGFADLAQGDSMGSNPIMIIAKMLLLIGVGLVVASLVLFGPRGSLARRTVSR